MQVVFALQQSVSMEQATADLMHAGIGVLAIGVLIGAAIGGLIVGLILKLVAQGVLGYSVRYGSCFLAVFVATLVQGAVGLALALSGVIKMGDLQTASSGGAMAMIMPYGPMVFAASTLVGILVMAWAIRTFVKSPNNVSPPWGSSFVIAIIMIVIGLALNYALAAYGPMAR